MRKWAVITLAVAALVACLTVPAYVLRQERERDRQAQIRAAESARLVELSQKELAGRLGGYEREELRQLRERAVRHDIEKRSK